MQFKEWEQEQKTLHLLTQMLGKYKVALAHKEPQWEHIILDITVQGVSTGMLHDKGQSFSLSINLVNDEIEIVTTEQFVTISLQDGVTIKEYYELLQQNLKELGVDVAIHTRPQEMDTTTPFEEDTSHHHYSSEVSHKVLNYFKLAHTVETEFLSPLRTRKIKPGLFWGTFDVSSALVYNAHEPFPDDTKVIERAAFDEPMIEFGFWFGDKNFSGPTFFVLAYPFPSITFECAPPFPDGSYFDETLMEFILELGDVDGDVNAKVVQFFEQSYHRLKDYLEWEGCEHYHLPLKMKDNHQD
ncbi:hypothetical protein JCM19037_3864 [Geomicrobium sp. JCM 19037]|uniref:DUF5996 family protein n=1 Tax=Geomicrobium sp. JCM 19037 TaxID=1460634 RepID=UPI00045F4B63|nr:DUF5996 family protein [Geomicrobium sp. JCM 19037]GAK05371.1 hypothetical protein JCM19037_3864 [Geomicrobium sp. JCM 19037]